MGLRVGLDGRALGNINRFRGIGRYTARLVESLVRADADIEFILFGYGEAPQPDLLDPGVLNMLEWRQISNLEKLSYLGLLGEHLLLARTVEEAGVDIFHGMDHNMTPFLRCPSIVTVHDLILLVLRGPYLGPKAWLWMQAHRRAAQRASRVVAVSQSTKRDVERIWGIPRERIAVVPEGVTPEYHPVEDDKAVDEAAAEFGMKRPYFLYLGGFDPRKNLHNMLLSFKRFALAGGKGFQMVLVGDARGFEGYLHDEIEELGLRDKVVLPGFIPEDSLPALYCGASAFICVSLYEGFGLPLLEAMACGTPVLASRASSIPEVVGDAGLLVDPLEPEQIAEGMEKLAGDRGFAEELSLKGLSRARQFSWEKTADTIIDVYREVAEGGEGG